MQLVRPERYEEFTNALVSLVHRSLGSRMAAGGGAAEQVRVRRPRGCGCARRLLVQPPLAAAGYRRLIGTSPNPAPLDIAQHSSHHPLWTPSLAPQMVVVLDCRGASSMSMTRHMGLLKRFAVTMTHHFPVRQQPVAMAELAGWR